MASTQISKEISTKLLIFRCCCGMEILIVPDLDAMNIAIKNHLIEHKELTGYNLTEEKLTQELLKTLSRAI
jgi:hypothetical protein